ncbi:MAG: hypothetical protein H9W83_12420 [Leuconostoc sp.]|nr:hypothetical protein [Leuconostoc sp.]
MGFLDLFKSKATKEREKQEKLELEQQRYELIQKFETEDLSQRAAIISDINMKPNEYCYYRGDAYYSWQEERSRTVRTNYKGVTANFRIAKGINYRMGSIKHESQKIKEWRNVFTGVPFITNKRIIFVSHTGMKTISLSSLVGMKAFTDGTQLFRESGKVLLLRADDPLEFNIILNRILAKDF